MDSLLNVEQIHTSFIENGERVERLKDVSFQVKPGEVVCVVGESGSGKSITALSVMGLLALDGKVTKGQVTFDGKTLLNLKEKQLDKIRGNQLTMIFQDALTALNPVIPIGKQIVEAIEVHMGLSKKQAQERAQMLLGKVGLPKPKEMMKRFPHTLSGGMRQRVMIAMALSCNPKLLIADEPTTALDVTIQAQILSLLKELREENHLALLLITHDIGVVAEMADRVIVMYAGEIVEEGTVWEIFDHPSHPYTKGLFASVPDQRLGGKQRLEAIQGSVPENYHEMTGCRFYKRCPYKQEACLQPQGFLSLEGSQKTRCWLGEKVKNNTINQGGEKNE